MSAKKKTRRSGYLYVAVLFTSLIVGATVATAISLDTTRLRSLNARADRGAALRSAEGELHRLAVQLNEDPSWRQTEVDGRVSAWRSIDRGETRVRYQINDPDGDLSDDELDDVQIIAHALYGSSQAAVAVELDAGYAPLKLLQYGVTATDDIECYNGAILVSESPVQVQDDCKAFDWGAIICPRLECSNRIEVSVRGDVAPSSVEAPPPGEIVDRYVEVGTEIPFASLPIRGSQGLRGVVLSSSSNPMGPTDPEGRYWIDCGGQVISIGDCRIHATVAIRNAALVVISGGLIWEGPGAMGAMLVTDATVVFNGYNATLDETLAGVNLNPVVAPMDGRFDSSLDDQYSSSLRGILYSSRNVRVYSTFDSLPVHLTGAVVARDLELHVGMQVHAANELIEQVPYGFVDPQRLRFLSGTFRRVSTP